MMRGRLPVVACVLAVAAAPLSGQDYHVRVDARGQSVWFRGLALDSIPAGLAVTSSSGGLETADGHAVRCSGDYCYFFTPGPALHGVPASVTASAAVWGLGFQGLSFRGTGRLIGDLGSGNVWPATEPAVQLIEGYLEYRRSAITARAGRQLVSSRLESIGFDGGWLRARWDRASLEAAGYAGWGLGQAAAVSATSPALNPLDEWRPRNRQIVAGAEAAWSFRTVDLRGEYRREVDPEDNYFVSERAALSMGASLAALRMTGGLDYNIAEGHLGNADMTLAYYRPRFSVSAGARQYRPYFSLWTLWGAFSPVPYKAVNIAAQGRATDWLSLHARAERYRYDDAGISTALVPHLEDRGWRTTFGTTGTFGDRLSVDGTYGLEHGPGASSRSADGTVTWTPSQRVSLDVYAGSLVRPLELRYYDATSRWIGGRAQLQLTDQRRIWGDFAFIGDNRDRPDAGASSLDQVRLRAGVSFALGSGADRTPLPPARPTRR